MINKVIQGDTLEVLKTIPDESVDCIITSPPYYGLRDYGVEGQVGLEKTLDDYLNKLLEITKECKRVLKKTGTLWWNHGDSYSTQHETGTIDRETGWKSSGNDRNPRQKEHGRANGGNIPTKSLMMTPYRLALRMIDEQGWIMRNQVIWFKPNCMPASVKDRFTVDYEPVFFFAKSKKYYFKQLLEPNITEIKKDVIWKGNQSRSWIKGKSISDKNTLGSAKNEQGRNKRCVWRVTTKPFKEAHFATFPEDLVRPMIDAGCPEGGIVLDPFAGAGTTLKVARDLGKNYIGIELNPEYVKIAEARIKYYGR
jgi:site-specific DNA-methyltransferase (adenine-specific)